MVCVFGGVGFTGSEKCERPGIKTLLTHVACRTPGQCGDSCLGPPLENLLVEHGSAYWQQGCHPSLRQSKESMKVCSITVGDDGGPRRMEDKEDDDEEPRTC